MQTAELTDEMVAATSLALSSGTDRVAVAFGIAVVAAVAAVFAIVFIAPNHRVGARDE